MIWPHAMTCLSPPPSHQFVHLLFFSVCSLPDDSFGDIFRDLFGGIASGGGGGGVLNDVVDFLEDRVRARGSPTEPGDVCCGCWWLVPLAAAVLCAGGYLYS